MHIFLTGATGYIGSAVLKQALAAGHTVSALTRSDTARAQVSQAGAQAVTGDIATPEIWMPQAVQADAFIHLASSFDDAMATTDPHLIATLRAHTKDRSTPLRFLYTGGCWMFGQTGNAVATEASPLTPITAFDWALDPIARVQKAPNLSAAVLHPAMVYDAQGGAFDRMVKALRARRPALIWGSEHTRWPLVHRSDAAAAYVLLAEAPDTGIFNVVAETGIAVGEIARVLAGQAGNQTKPAVLPRKWVRARNGPWAEGPMLDQQMMSTRMAGLGWTQKHRDFSLLQYDL